MPATPATSSASRPVTCSGDHHEEHHDQNSHEWIATHNGGTAPQGEGAAYNNPVYSKSVNRQASAHYFIDNGEVIWQCVELKDGAWSVGDSWSRNGANNRNSINIEVCGNW